MRKTLLFPLKNLFLLTILCFFISCTSDSPQEVTPPTPNYTLSVSAVEGGSVSSSGGSYVSGKVVTITANAGSEYIFSGWSNGSTKNPLTVTVNSNQTLSANFEKRKYPLTMTMIGEGTVSEKIIKEGRTETYLR